MEGEVKGGKPSVVDLKPTPHLLLLLQTLDTRPTYTEEELQRFEAELRDKEVELSRKRENLRQEQELLHERSKALEVQRKEYQQVGRVCLLRAPPQPDTAP